MFRLTLPAWALVILGGLALATSVLPEPSVGLTTTSDQSFTSSITLLATGVADPKHLNRSGTVRTAVTSIVGLCPISSTGVTASVLFPVQPSGSFSWSNQTFPKDSSTQTNPATVAVPQASDRAPKSSKSPDLIFDNGPTPLPLSTSTNSTLATGSGYRLIIGDPLLWLLFGMVNMGVV